MQLINMYLIYPFIAVAVIGFIVNLYCSLYFAFIIRISGPFSVLASFFLAANCLVLIPNLFVVPVMQFQLFSIPTFVNQRLGQIALIGYYAGYLTRFLLAINRYVAIHYYSKYGYYFSSKNVCTGIVVTSLISILMVSPASVSTVCSFEFDGLIWDYSDTPVCDVMSLAFDFWLGVTFALLIFSSDILLILRYMYIRKQGTLSMIPTTNSNNLKMELRIFFQAFLSNLYLVLMLVCFHVLEKMYATTPDTKFLLNTFLWISYHTFDGIFIGMFHNDVIKHLKSFVSQFNSYEMTQLINRNHFCQLYSAIYSSKRRI
uniref:7TM_GPCR_Srx domain-containing protein n=1 Tax=Rhabditophanes sp. KR3021 TaxID=114890 RepID=A0AC35TJC6_9BILA